MSASPVSIVNAGYRSTNYWVISAGRSRLLVDLGWPGTMGTLRATLSRLDVPLTEIRFGLATHYHIDHAGLADDGSVFTGDLTHPGMIGAEDAGVVLASWRLLKDRGARQVHAGHGPIRPLPALDGPPA